MCIVVGANDLDEANIEGPNMCTLVSGKKLEHFTIKPEEYGLSGQLPSIENAEESAERFTYLQNNFVPEDPIFKLICLNAGLALYIYGKTMSLSSGIGSVKVAFEVGLVKDFFERYKQYSQKLSTDIE